MLRSLHPLAWLVLVTLALLGAGPCENTAVPDNPGGTMNVPDVGLEKTTPELPDAPTEEPGMTWLIESGRVGDIRLGHPLPETLLADDQRLLDAYTARFIADAQPLEGYSLEDPPLLVALESGPFRAYVDVEGVVEPPLDSLRRPGLTAARDGAKVRAIYVQAPGPTTAKGVGVGSAYAALQGAYPDLTLRPVPPTFGKDLCFARTAEMPDVSFVFSSCKAAKTEGAVIRIDLWAPPAE